MKEDLRVFRTKKLLRNSIIELAIHQSKKLEDITVQEICDEALVHRTTFYRYYKDKYDLLLKEVKFEKELTIQERKRHIIAPFSLAFTDAPIPDIQKLLKLNVDDQHLQFLTNKSKIKTLTEDLSMFISKEDLPVPIEVAVKVYSSVMDELMHHWIHGQMKETPEQMDDYLRKVLSPFYFDILKDE